MVGIYAKIKNGLNWLKGKAAKYVAPVIGKIGDFANSDFVKGIAGLAAPVLDTFVPGLGTGINTGLSWVGKAGDVANGLLSDYKQYGDEFDISDMVKNTLNGKYSRKEEKPKTLDGISLSKRPDDLHSLIQLKALPSGDERTGSYVEELD